MTTRFVTTTIEDKPGQLGRLARVLGDQEININAFQADRGNVTLRTTDVETTVSRLNNNGFKATTIDALEVGLPNKPGQLAGLCEALGEAGVNIVSCFGSADEGRLFLQVDDVKTAKPVLERFGPATVETR